jgi:anti-repressor protein
MEQLIKIQTNQSGEQLVSARELHSFLQNTDNVNTWFKRQAERAMLIQDEDFTSVAILQPSGQKAIDYAISISAAKEIAMLNGGEKGKEARRYFLECEKLAKQRLLPSYQIENPVERAKKWIQEQEQVLLLQEENKKLQFRSDFVDVVFETDGLFTMEEVAKILKLPFGRNTMLRKLREKKLFLESNTPKQSLINSGYFKVSEQIIDTNKFKKLVSTAYATSKGIGYIHKIFKDEIKESEVDNG